MARMKRDKFEVGISDERLRELFAECCAREGLMKICNKEKVARVKYSNATGRYLVKMNGRQPAAFTTLRGAYLHARKITGLQDG